MIESLNPYLGVGGSEKVVTNTQVPFLLPGCTIDGVVVTEQEMLIQAYTVNAGAICPNCGHDSGRVHSYYTRTIRDLPISEWSVCLKVRIRRFRCVSQACTHQTFTERLPELVNPFAHRSNRLRKTLGEIGCFLSGEASMRLSNKLRMKSSGDTVLRLLSYFALTASPTPCVLGVDDWAQRRGRTYGTILVDLERRQVVDLLPDRTAETLSAWLQAHPGISIIARDRSTEYARGIKEGAPQALQVADRWHLLLNIREMLKRYLTRIYGRLKRLPQPAEGETIGEQPITTPMRVAFSRTQGERDASLASRENRIARYEMIQQMRRNGVSILEIAERLHLHRETVRTYYYAESFPERSQRKLQPSILDPFLPYLKKRHAQGCENASQLWREICQQGYPGSRSQVDKWMQLNRTQPAKTGPKKYRTEAESAYIDSQKRQKPKVDMPSVRELAWILSKEPAKLNQEEKRNLEWVQQDESVAKIYGLAQSLATMIRQRESAFLDAWLHACASSGISCLKTFAAGILYDYDAVRAALETEWSSGQTEGQVNRLKLIKRQMYGRASFDLLRLRVLQPS
jgi:transposase